MDGRWREVKTTATREVTPLEAKSRVFLAGALASQPMFGLRHLDLTLPSPEANLACDEALLDACDAGGRPGVLRFWEPCQPFVVLGYANHAASEVNVAACQGRDIPILRRCTGGGTVLQGPGCLNYALVLPVDADARLGSVTETNRFILEQHRQALGRLLAQTVLARGQTDLALGALKFSGNAQRRKGRAILFHGTFLLGLDLALMEELLRFPSRQPDYRQGRSHAEFVAHLPLDAPAVKQVLRQVWSAGEPLELVPLAETEALVQSRYGRAEWNLRL
jgi:lipoate---protein ligase